MMSCGGPRHREESCGCGTRGYAFPLHRRHYVDPGLEGWGGGALGVRRPLRFLAWKLELRDDQVQQLAAVLDELKTERAQAEVDQRRSLGILADVIGAEAFDAARGAEAAGLRNQSTQRLQEAVIKALGRMHALLEPEQRQRLAYLIRTGAVML